MKRNNNQIYISISIMIIILMKYLENYFSILISALQSYEREPYQTIVGFFTFYAIFIIFFLFFFIRKLIERNQYINNLVYKLNPSAVKKYIEKRFYLNRGSSSDFSNYFEVNYYYILSLLYLKNYVAAKRYIKNIIVNYKGYISTEKIHLLICLGNLFLKNKKAFSEEFIYVKEKCNKISFKKDIGDLYLMLEAIYENKDYTGKYELFNKTFAYFTKNEELVLKKEDDYEEKAERRIEHSKTSFIISTLIMPFFFSVIISLIFYDFDLIYGFQKFVSLMLTSLSIYSVFVFMMCFYYLLRKNIENNLACFIFCLACTFFFNIYVALPSAGRNMPQVMNIIALIILPIIDVLFVSGNLYLLKYDYYGIDKIKIK